MTPIRVVLYRGDEVVGDAMLGVKAVEWLQKGINNILQGEASSEINDATKDRDAVVALV